uniref:Uncharacterized protein n=1 Tax=Rhizophagus irregularis (strain DAOM 181602 / DAOM 197198 / MUCL 43194) TaxID=747089 RepID=U9TKH2_RHIID
MICRSAEFSFEVRTGKSDLQLDNISIGHICKILQQSLYNCSVNPDPWESIISRISFDVSDTVLKAIEKK